MQNNYLKFGMYTLLIAFMSTSLVFAQGMGGGNHGGGPGGHGGGWGQGDSTLHDSSGHGGDHHGPGWGQGDSTDCDSTGCGHHGGGFGGGWGHGDSTMHDSSGHSGHQWGGHHGGGHGGPGHGFGHGDSLNLDSIFVSGVITKVADTMSFNGDAFIHVSYFLDVDADLSADYRLVQLHRLLSADSNFVFPVDGDQVEVTGFLIPSDELLDRIAVRDLTIVGEGELFGGLLAADPTNTGMHHKLQSRNYPNPFNPSTSIEFSLGAAGHVALIIYDITGAQVTQLVDGNYSAGLHTVQFNPSSLGAGTYLYVLESNGVRTVKRMAYLK